MQRVEVELAKADTLVILLLAASSGMLGKTQEKPEFVWSG